MSFVKAKEKAKDAGNAANREKTVLRNAVKEYWLKNSMPIGSFIRTGGMEFRYEATERETVNANYILTMFEEGKISRENFLACITASKSDVQTLLGGDIALAATKITTGDKADIRVSDLPVENEADEFIFEQSKMIQTKEPLHRRVISKTSGNAKRNIRIKGMLKK